MLSNNGVSYKQLVVVGFVLVLLFTISGCGGVQTSAEDDLKAVKGIAFLIIESIYAEDDNDPAIQDGIEYSGHWLSGQPEERRVELEELSAKLSKLVVDINNEMLEQLTSEPESIPGKLEEQEKQQLEKAIAAEEGFSFEWEDHKRKLRADMQPGIEEFKEELQTLSEDEVRQVINTARDAYTQSQPLLEKALASRINNIFSP